MPIKVMTVTAEEWEYVTGRLNELGEEVAFLKATTDDWVDSQTACKLTGRDEKTLRREREDEASPLSHKNGGHRKAGRTVRYSRAALRKYNLGRGRGLTLPTTTTGAGK